MENEEQKIRDYIKKNRSFLQERNMDIAYSDTCGDWFIYDYNKSYHYYEYFIRFTTLEQLETIIREELLFLEECLAEKDPAVPTCEADSIAEIVSHNYKSPSKITLP